MDDIPTVGKNTQQIRGAISKQLKTYNKLLNQFCASARVEAVLINHIQVCNHFRFSVQASCPCKSRESSKVFFMNLTS